MDMSKLKSLMADKKAAMQKREKTAKLNPGKNRIRLLPGWRKGEEHVWYHEFGQHFIKDAADQIQAVYVCTQATFERPCEVCNAMAAASKAIHDDDTQKVLEKARPSRSVLINALLLDSTEPNTPQILEIKRSVFSQLIEIIEEYGGDEVFDLERGREILVTRDGKGLNTTYTSMLRGTVYKVPPAALSKLHNLDDYVKQESDEQMRRAVGAVNAVAGVLPAPTGRDVPATPAARLAAPAAAAADEFTDVPDFIDTPTAAGAPVDDSDLDALLGDLA